MTLFQTLILFSNHLETEEDYKIWIMALYKLFKNNIQDKPELKLIFDVILNAMETAEKTGTYINYFSKALAAEMRKIPTEELDCTI